MRLPWFRAHSVLFSDPGRLLSVHLIHTGLVSGWAGSIALFEIFSFDNNNNDLNPIWIQGCYVLPFITRLGVHSSWTGWFIGTENDMSWWSFEVVALAHIALSGLLFLASIWHWTFWDLSLFRVGIDLPSVFGIHLALASFLCFSFGSFHLTGFWGPGFWCTDKIGLNGELAYLKPLWGPKGFNPENPGGLVRHHIAAGLVGFGASFFHLNVRPSIRLYKLLRIGNTESVLSSSLAAVFFASLIASGAIWYGTASTPVDLFGPSRFSWDQGFFHHAIEHRVGFAQQLGLSFDNAWLTVPNKLLTYDRIGSNPAKGGLFRAGSINQATGNLQEWFGFLHFFDGSGTELFIRRMPSFFETFPVLFFDKFGILLGDLPFRRAESQYSLEQVGVEVIVLGGVYHLCFFFNSQQIKDLARIRPFGQIFIVGSNGDGFRRTSIRGWFVFAHVCFSILFFFGHLWHGGRTLFRDLLSGIDPDLEDQIEFGRWLRVGGDQ